MKLLRQVGASSDDAGEKADTTVDLTAAAFNITTSAVNPIWAGFRFQNVTIPQGASIVSAHLELAVGGGKSGDDMDVDIYGEKVANSSTFTTAASNISGRTRTTAVVTWTAPNLGTNRWVSSANIATIIQEIVNQGTWASGNAMSLLLNARSTQIFTINSTFDAGAWYGARLVVYYVGGPAPVIINLAVHGDSITQGTQTYEQGYVGAWPQQWAGRLSNLTGRPVIGSGVRGLWLGGYFSVGTTTHTGEFDGAGTWTKYGNNDADNKTAHSQQWGGANGSGSILTWTPPNLWREPIVGFAVYWVDTGPSSSVCTSGNFQYMVDNSGTWINMGETIVHDNKLKKFYVPQTVNNSVQFRQYDGSAAAGCTIAYVEGYFDEPRTEGGVIMHNLGRFGHWLAVETSAISAGADPFAWYDQCVLGTNAVPHKPIFATLEYVNDISVYHNPSKWTTDLGIWWTRASTMNIPWVLHGMYEMTSETGTDQDNYRNNSISFVSSTASPNLRLLNIFANWRDNRGLGGVGVQGPNIYGYGSAGMLMDGTHPSEAGNTDWSLMLTDLTLQYWAPPWTPRWAVNADGLQVGLDQIGSTRELAGSISTLVATGQGDFFAFMRDE